MKQLSLFDNDVCVGRDIWLASGFSLLRLKVTDLTTPYYPPHYFTCVDKNKDMWYVSLKNKGVFWEFSKEDASKLLFTRKYK